MTEPFKSLILNSTPMSLVSLYQTVALWMAPSPRNIG